MAKPSLTPGLREPTPRLSWQALDVLAVIRSMHARPGVPVDVGALTKKGWLAKPPIGGEVLEKGLGDLVDAGLVEPFKGDATAIFITDAAL
jgi:hypothetical protein